MQISEAAGGAPAPAAGAESCRFPKLEECAHFHYERVQLPQLSVTLQTNMDQSLHSQHTNNDEEDTEWHMVQVTSGDECWLVQRSYENFKMLDAQLHQCIYDRKISHLPDLSSQSSENFDVEELLMVYLERFCRIADNSINCGPILNWFQMDNKGHRLLVPSEESRSINTPAVAAAYSVRRYVSQARDELNLEVGDMISVIDMASPGESIWWRGKRGFQVGFFPQHCVHIIGDKVPRNMPLPPPVVGSLALSPIKPVLRKHGKLIAFFRSFILNRPSRRRLKQSGILKERVFGCDLGEHLLNSGHDIPMVLKCCAEFIETHGIVDGIYRLSGVTSNIQKLRNAFDEDRIPNLYTEDILQDIHSVASLLKMYFRELPNPLCTYQLYQSFVNAVQGCNTTTRNSENDHERLLKMREAVQKLPPPHYRTLEYLMRHLARVAKHGSSTGMTTRNVAIVWAPNLLRCAELEVGGVAALQGVGVQAVVTEFLICYADLIFSDHLPNLDHPSLTTDSALSPKRCRPKSLAISTPTKLITLEEARSKHMLSKGEDCGYIEVGGGPGNLPKKYHTVIELPPGSRKRGLSKRSPLGWRSFFSKSRNSSQGSLTKNRKASTPSIVPDKSVTESDLTDMKRKLRSVKSAESLTSGHSEPASNDIDVLGPLHSLHKPPGHNRSVSHDSYFDTLQNSQNNSEGSLLDLSEIQLNFELEESEMRIFSEDESLVSSPRLPRDAAHRKTLTRSRPDENCSAANSGNPSPKKQARVVLSPDSMSRKRTRLEDQLSDIQFIDCSTPENVYTISTTAVIHALPEPQKTPEVNVRMFDAYQPKNKSPRNSEIDAKRQSLNLEKSPKTQIPKSLTDTKLILLGSNANAFNTPTPQSPIYKPLCDSSSGTTPELSPSSDVNYQKLIKNLSETQKPLYENVLTQKSASPPYENVLTTISITYKSPTRSLSVSPTTNLDSVYEDVLVNPEKALIPTSTASLPIQQAREPLIEIDANKTFLAPEKPEETRPKSLSALEDFTKPKKVDYRTNLSTEALCDTSEVKNENLTASTTNSDFSDKNLSSDQSFDFNSSDLSATACYKSDVKLSNTDVSFSEVVHSSTEENLSNSISDQLSPTLSPNVSPSCTFDHSKSLLNNFDAKRTSQSSLLDHSSRLSSAGDLSAFEPNKIDSNAAELENNSRNSNLIDFSPEEPKPSTNEKRKSSETESLDDNAIYQQVKYFRRSVHEINALLDLQDGENCAVDAQMDTVDDKTLNSSENLDSLEAENVQVCRVYENVELRDSLENNAVEDEKIEEKLTKAAPNVKNLTNLFEAKEEQTQTRKLSNSDQPPIETEKPPIIPENSPPELAKTRKNYDKDSLPPCLRARNLKNQIKTRSLDEDEFKREFGLPLQRRKSMDENVGKLNGPPKVLNQPKTLPSDGGKSESVHLAHSAENVGVGGGVSDQLRRERIEKYKEERRKFFQDKYRSESFKEDKDVLLSRLKLFKSKEEKIGSNEEAVEEPKTNPEDQPTRLHLPRSSTRRRSSRETDSTNDMSPSNNTVDILDEDNAKLNRTERLSTCERIKTDKKETASILPENFRESFKSKTAMFESHVNQRKPPESGRKIREKDASEDSKKGDVKSGFKDKDRVSESDKDIVEDFVRNRKKDDDYLKSERRRHTYESRERETESERIRRVSLENRSPRKEKMSPSYCIRDMKAIFESKSKQ